MTVLGGTIWNIAYKKVIPGKVRAEPGMTVMNSGELALSVITTLR